MWKIFNSIYFNKCQATPIFKPGTPEPVSRVHQGSRMGASPILLRSRESRAAVREANDIGETNEEAVNVIYTIPGPVKESEPAENAKDTEKSEYAIRFAEISVFTLP